MEPKGDGRDDHVQASTDVHDEATATATDKFELPKSFEDCDIDHLVVLIGACSWSLLIQSGSHRSSSAADMLERLMKHNDKIPLSPYVDAHSELISLRTHS